MKPVCLVEIPPVFDSLTSVNTRLTDLHHICLRPRITAWVAIFASVVIHCEYSVKNCRLNDPFLLLPAVTSSYLLRTSPSWATETGSLRSATRWRTSSCWVRIVFVSSNSKIVLSRLKSSRMGVCCNLVFLLPCVNDLWYADPPSEMCCHLCKMFKNSEVNWEFTHV